MALLPFQGCINRPLAAHSDNHAGDSGGSDLFRKNLSHLLRIQVCIVVRKQNACLLLIAHKAVDRLQKIPAFQGDAHIGHHGVDRGMVLLRQGKHPLDHTLVDIDFNNDTFGILENLIAVVVQNIRDGPQVRALGNRGVDIAILSKHRQPGSHAVGSCADIVGVDLVIVQLGNYILADAGFVHKADKGGAKLAVCHILGNIPAHAAVNLFNSACVTSGGNKRPLGISLNVNKYRSNHNNAHGMLPLFLCMVSLYHS